MSSVDGHRGLGEVYVQIGMYDKAIVAMRNYVDLTRGRTDYALGYLGYAYGMAGQRDKALETLKTLRDRAQRHHVMSYAYAPLYIGLGDSDRAIEALQREYEEALAHTFSALAKSFSDVRQVAFRFQIHRPLA